MPKPRAVPKPRYPKHEKILVLARGEIGVREEPIGSNTGRRVLEYQRATWLGGTNWPWCAAFCCFVAEHAGFKLGYRGAGAYQWYDVGAKIVGKQIPTARYVEVIPGDFVVFRIGSGHIGIVESIQDGAVTSIDGNTSDQVARRVRSMRDVYGFVGLAEKAEPPKKPPKPATWEVVTSESGRKVIYVSGLKAIISRLPRFLKRFPKGVEIRPRPKVK